MVLDDDPGLDASVDPQGDRVAAPCHEAVVAAGPLPAMMRKIRMLSLGGCVTHDVCSRAQSPALLHVDHLWRRPTVALMAPPARALPFLDTDFPPVLARYWQDDFRKHHRREIADFEADVLVFDLTRDVNCGFIEVEDLVYVIDPVSSAGLFVNPAPTITYERLREMMGRDCTPLDFRSTAYAELWAYHFDRFADLVRCRFKTIVLNRIYYTTTVASNDALSAGDPAYVGAANAFLDSAYDYIAARHGDIAISTIPRAMFMTGVDVPYGGPTFNHFVAEASSMFAENVRRLAAGHFHVTGSLFMEAAIDRIKKHEDLLRAFDAGEARIRALTAEAEALRARLAEAERPSRLRKAWRALPGALVRRLRRTFRPRPHG